MSNTDSIEILRRHSIRPTANRMMIVRAMDEAGRPLSMSELEIMLPTIDKSNIFRALSLFDKYNMVHRIEDGSDSIRYELCHSHDDCADSDIHPHFYCESCHKSFCLEEAGIPEISIPKGYKVHSVNYVLKGICPDCSNKNS